MRLCAAMLCYAVLCTVLCYSMVYGSRRQFKCCIPYAHVVHNRRYYRVYTKIVFEREKKTFEFLLGDFSLRLDSNVDVLSENTQTKKQNSPNADGSKVLRHFSV